MQEDGICREKYFAFSSGKTGGSMEFKREEIILHIPHAGTVIPENCRGRAIIPVRL